MAIRSRLKALVKKSLFGSSNTNQTNSPRVTPTPTFTQEPVSTAASSGPTPPSSTETAVESFTEQSTEPTPEPTTEPSETHTAEVAQSEAPPEANIDEATFVIDVVDLFPEKCPNCDANSHNNWIRIENRFACGSCKEPYTA